MFPLVRSFMIVGSGPQVGKTLVTCAMVQSLLRKGQMASAMKPLTRFDIQRAGVWCSSELERLAAASALGLPPHALCTTPLPSLSMDETPAIPGEAHDAAVDNFHVLSTWSDAVVIEGADDVLGIGVGCNSSELALELQLPAVVVVGTSANCERRARTRITTMEDGGIKCLGWITHQHRAQGETVEKMRHRLADLPIPCLGAIPWLDDCTPLLAAAHMDLEKAYAALAT